MQYDSKKKKTKKALDKAQRGRDKLAKKGVGQLRTKLRASSKRPRGSPVKQIQSKAPVAVATEPEAEIVPEQPRSRTGRAVKRPRFFHDI